MPRSSARLLRLGALLLLVLSIVARPMLEQLGDTHAVEHAVLAAADADHGHGHEHDDHDTGGDPEHTRGLHGLMHQAECGVFAVPALLWGLALDMPPTTSPSLPDTGEPRAGIPATPFRPPIA